MNYAGYLIKVPYTTNRENNDPWMDRHESILFPENFARTLRTIVPSTIPWFWCRRIVERPSGIRAVHPSQEGRDC